MIDSKHDLPAFDGAFTTAPHTFFRRTVGAPVASAIAARPYRGAISHLRLMAAIVILAAATYAYTIGL